MARRLAPIAAVLLALAVAGFASLASAATAEAGQCRAGSAAPHKLDKHRAKRAIRCLINRQRRSRGIAPLKLARSQTKAARKHTKLMIRRGCWAHQCSGEKDLVARLSSASYLPCNCYWGVAENLGYGERRLGSPRSIFKAWMGSAPHRRNVLGRRFEHIGIGVVWGTPDNGRDRRAATYTIDFGYRD